MIAVQNRNRYCRYFTFSTLWMMNITDYLEKEQVDQVLAAAHKCSQRDYLMLRVLWRTGVRVNELLTITPRDIEPKNNVINVTKAKGGKQRRVHLDAETIKMLFRIRFSTTTPR